MLWAIQQGLPKCTANIGEIDGTLMLVEPFANHKVEDNLNPLGGISPMILDSNGRSSPVCWRLSD